MKVTKIISDLLVGQFNYCCLCFKTFKSVDENAFRLHDEIIVMNHDGQPDSAEIFDVLTRVLGDKITSKIESSDIICQKCTETARTSYNFIDSCENNIEVLIQSLDSLANCLDNTIHDVENYNSIFIHSNSNYFSSEQYYDKENIVKNPKTIAKRFNTLVNNNFKNHNKHKTAKDPKAKRTRIHSYSKEIAKICDVIRKTNKSKFRCKVCLAVFTKSFNFKKHYYSQHSQKSVTCTECGKSYGSEILLKQHKYDSHASIMCNHCGKTYKNRYSMLYHMRQHSGEQPYECPHCDMKFHWSSRRAEHIRRYHLEPGVECDICHSKFRALGSLYEHRKRHFNPNSRLHVTQPTPPVAEEQVIEFTCDADDVTKLATDIPTDQ